MANKRLKELVKKEADAIREHASEVEIKQLRFPKFKPTQVDGCIYGLMTGSCFSNRASELLSKCAIPYSSSLGSKSSVHRNHFKPDEGTWREMFSAIEFYIYRLADRKEAKPLLEYIKGKTDVLELV